jgi:hypothetical protein
MMRPRHTISVLALATVLMLGLGGAAQAACYGSGQELPAQEVSQFINEPAQLLTRFPSGGPQMTSLIRDLIASEPGSLPLIIDLNAKANAEQLEAIGAGLGQAALVCNRNAPAFASEIQLLIATADNRPLSQAFSAVMGDLFLSWNGPAGGAGGGGGGGGPTATSGPIEGGAVGGATLNLTTSVRNGFTNSPNSHAFGPATPWSGPGGGVSPPNTYSKSVSPSRP